MATPLDTTDENNIEHLSNITPPQNRLTSQVTDEGTYVSVTQGQPTRADDTNQFSCNSETGNKSPMSAVRLEVKAVVDHRDSQVPSDNSTTVTSQPAPQSSKDLPSTASSGLARSPVIYTQATASKPGSIYHSRRSSVSGNISPSDDIHPLVSAHQQTLVPSYKLIPVGSDVLSDLKRKLNDLHKNIINLDGDYWVLTGMFEKTNGKIMQSHGWKSSRENHKPIFDLETEVESMKDMTIAYGKLSDLDKKKIEHMNALNKRFETAFNDFANLKKILTDLRIDLEGDAIVQYPTRSEYLVIGNQPNHPRQFYKDASGQWVQNGTVRKASPSKQKPVINAIRAYTPTKNLVPDDLNAPVTLPKNMSAAKLAVSRLIRGFDMKVTRHGSTSSSDQHPTTESHPVWHPLQDAVDKLEGKNRELEMDKANLNAKLILHSRQSKETRFVNATIEQLTKENNLLSVANSRLQAEKRVLENENSEMKNSNASGKSLGKHLRSTDEELDEIKTKKRKLEREVKELEYKKEDLEDGIKAMEKKIT